MAVSCLLSISPCLNFPKWLSLALREEWGDSPIRHGCLPVELCIFRTSERSVSNDLLLFSHWSAEELSCHLSTGKQTAGQRSNGCSQGRWDCPSVAWSWQGQREPSRSFGGRGRDRENLLLSSGGVRGEPSGRLAEGRSFAVCGRGQLLWAKNCCPSETGGES